MGWLFFDTEATGVDPAKDRVIQVALVSADLSFRYEQLVNPGRPIPPEVQELTGITDAMVADALTFRDICVTVAAMLSKQTLVGFGCNQFDVPLLAEEFERSGIDFKWPTVIDAGALFKIHAPRNLTAAVRHYCGRELVGAHGAAADALGTRDVFLTMVGRHAELAGLDSAAIAKAARFGREMVDPAGTLTRIDGVVCYATRRNRGMPVANDIGYAEWILRSDFPLATKRALRAELERIAGEPEEEVEDYGDAVSHEKVEIPF